MRSSRKARKHESGITEADIARVASGFDEQLGALWAQENDPPSLAVAVLFTDQRFDEYLAEENNGEMPRTREEFLNALEKLRDQALEILKDGPSDILTNPEQREKSCVLAQEFFDRLIGLVERPAVTRPRVQQAPRL